MFDTLIIFAVIILISLVFKSLYGKTDNISEGIHAVVFNVMLPALCIKTFSTTKLDHSLIFEVVSAWLIILGTLLVGFVVLRVFRLFYSPPSQDIGVMLAITSFGNVLFLGAPVLTGLYGSEAFRHAVVFDFFATTIILWTVGAFIACNYGERKEFNLKSSIKNIALLPPLWGIVIGVVINLSGFQLDKPVLKGLTMLGDTVTPLMIFSIGLSLKIPTLKYSLILIPFLVVKLILSPLLAFYVTGLFPLNEIARKSIIMESAMPVIVLFAVVAAKFKLNETLTSLAITLSTAISFITLPIIAHLLEALI
ncbi:MAG: AEC family transporter [Thermodesulfovibrionales bacterium]|nr:AEC family transporter [Thermodesulfovibrionales bacterium]